MTGTTRHCMPAGMANGRGSGEGREQPGEWDGSHPRGKVLGGPWAEEPLGALPEQGGTGVGILP